MQMALFPQTLYCVSGLVTECLQTGLLFFVDVLNLHPLTS